MVNCQSLEQFVRDNLGLVHKVASKHYPTAVRLGLPIEYSDLIQEYSVVMIRAARAFDPDRGLQFSTYFYRACFNEWRRIVDANNERHEHGTRSVEEQEGLVESLVGDYADPETLCQGMQELARRIDKLTPRARQALDWLFSPPEGAAVYGPRAPMRGDSLHAVLLAMKARGLLPGNEAARVRTQLVDLCTAL